ncbi:MAG: hypothetical protein CMP76_15075 [Flavobacterium sp.]|uniref:hypothetical protein n=1 Tax=unclassified Flavobacterium TaxID=196869 RepID=UPI000C3C1946|nr:MULTISPECIES: hypothetical protein [unclassified Flavobacterium]MBF04604.1 hypothetical protein [Flavobacterium sp.]MCO6162903.1 hypothetical protein [Flavobacterium sp. NRK F7]|tara:strand:- start:2013 stop:2444 length:432 start_codon:yes stop_codon:yes gene_type:complete
MKNPKDFFNIISYLQYPFILIGAYYAFHPYFNEFVTIWSDLNNVLIYFGLGISFSTLQDTTKTQNKFSKRIWENPQKGKRMIIFMTFFCLSLLTIGMFSMYITQNKILKEIAFGLIVLGIGYISFLKAAIEIFENHRKDKKLK